MSLITLFQDEPHMCYLGAVVMTTMYDLIIFPLGKNSVHYVLFSLYMIFGSFKESSSYFCDLDLAIHFTLLMKFVNGGKISNPINTCAVLLITDTLVPEQVPSNEYKRTFYCR